MLHNINKLGLINLSRLVREEKIDVIKLVIQEAKASRPQHWDINSEEDVLRAMREAISLGKIEIVTLFLDEGVYATGFAPVRYDSMPYVYFAAEKGHLDILKLFVARGATFKPRDLYYRERNKAAIAIAVKNGHIAVVEFLLQQGADVNGLIEDSEYETLFSYAALHNHTQILDLLVSFGNENDVKNAIEHAYKKYGNAIEYAQRILKTDYNQEVRENLLKSIAGPAALSRDYYENQLNNFDKQKLELEKNLQENLVNYAKIIGKLLDYASGVDFSNKDNKGLKFLSLLPTIKGMNFIGVSVAGHAITKEMLAEEKLNANENLFNLDDLDKLEDKQRQTLLRQQLDLKFKKFGFLLENETVNLLTLWRAAQVGHTLSVKTRLAAGIDPNQAERSYPIVYAAENGHEEIVDLLMAHEKFDVTSLDIAIYRATESKHSKIVAKMQQRKDMKLQLAQELLKAAGQGEEKQVELVLKQVEKFSVDIDTQSKWGKTALYLASAKGHLRIVELLLSAKADIEKADQEGRTPLMEAAWTNHLPVVQRLIAEGAKINAVRHDGWNALINAASYGCDTVVDFLLQHKPEINYQDKSGQTGLMQAAKGSNQKTINCLQSLLEAKADPNLKDKEGKTALLLVAERKENIKKMELLLAAKAEIDVRDKNLHTPLLHACINGHVAQAKMLIIAGANVNVVDAEGMTALMYAVRRNFQLVDLLINAGVNVDAIAQNGQSALARAMQFYVKYTPYIIMRLRAKKAIDTDCNTDLMFAIVSQQFQDLEKYLSPNTINTQNKRGETALMLQAEWGDITLLRTLMEAGAEINLVDGEGNTALMRLLIKNDKGYAPAIDFLLESNAQLNIANRGGYTPLMLAVKTNQPNFVEKFLKKGAFVDQINTALGKKDQTALYMVIKKSSESVEDFEKHREIISLLLNHGASLLVKCGSVSALNLAELISPMKALISEHLRSLDKKLIVMAENGNTASVIDLLKLGANANAENDRGESVLLLAARSGHLEVVKVLLASGARVNQQNCDSTPLIDACWKGHLSVVQCLVEANADIQATQKDGSQALHHATSYGRNEIVSFLLAQGAPIDATDKLGRTALMIAAKHACEYKHFAVLQHLLLSKAKVNLVDSQGNSALFYLCQNAHASALVLQTLLEVKAEVNKQNLLGETPLMMVGANPWNDGMQKIALLYAAGAVINCLNKEGENVLFYAVNHNGAAAVISYLLQLKADAHTMTPKGGNALRKALESYEGEENALILIKHGCKFATDEKGNNALMLALKAGKLDAAAQLISQLDIEAKNNQGETALMMAVRPRIAGPRSSTQLVKEILEAKADINAVDNDGKTALMHSSFFEAELALFLISQDAKTGVAAKDGSTALIQAVRCSATEVVKALLSSKEPNVDAQGQDGRSKTTALLLAARL